MYKNDEHMQRMRKQMNVKAKEIARREKLENLKSLRNYAKKIKESEMKKEDKKFSTKKKLNAKVRPQQAKKKQQQKKMRKKK